MAPDLKGNKIQTGRCISYLIQTGCPVLMAVSLYAMADTKAAGAPNRTHYSTYKHTNVACHAYEEKYPPLHPPLSAKDHSQTFSAWPRESQKDFVRSVHKSESNGNV